MKEEHQDKLAELLIGYTEKAGETTGTIVEWLQIQAPELCSEIITYNLVYHGFLLALGFVLLSAVIPNYYWGKHLVNNPVKCRYGSSDVSTSELIAAPITLSVCLVIAWIIILNFHLPTVLKCYFAPKLFLLEYMKGFI